MSFLMDFWTFPFLTKALIAVILLSVVCGLLSPMVVAKKFAFMGASISHGALLGVAVSLSFISRTEPLASAWIFFITLLVTLLAVSPLAFSTFRQRLPSDALIGLFFTGTMGLGLLIHQSGGAGSGDLLSYLFGNILTLDNFDIGLLLVLVLIVVPTIWFLRLRWMFFLFDEEAAAIQGMATKRYHTFLFILLTLVIVGGLKISGVILINSFLLIPGIFALKWSPNARKTFIYGVVFALKTTILGLILANAANLPAGASIAVTQVFFYLISVAFHRLRTVKTV